MNEILTRPPGLATPLRSVLDDALLERIAARAAVYDRENRFFSEDLEELRAAGYLRLAVPVELGGLGFSLPEVVQQQRRLAQRAPSTALALTMHLYWIGAALELYKAGDRSAKWILEQAAAGALFASGHGEPGNDLGLAGSSVRAEPLPDGGYRFTGRKIFTSLSPAWAWLGIHGLDESDPRNRRIVHAFVHRDAPGHRTVETWDTLGVRATRSDDTILEGVIAKPEHVTRVLPAGPPNDPFIDGILAWVMPNLSAVYYGIAERALDLAIANARRRTSAALDGKTYAHQPFTQWSVAEATIELEGILAHIEKLADDWHAGVPHGPAWGLKFLALKQHAVDGAKRVVDLALKIHGASALFKSNEIERLYRDVRSGPFHPPNSDAIYDVIAKSRLGLL